MHRPETKPQRDRPGAVSAGLKSWRARGKDTTLGGLIGVFGPGSFAIVFVLLLGLPALPLPTGGATHVFEVIAVMLALQLIVGRREIWLPQRWRGLELGGPRQQRFLDGLIRVIRWFERFSRPRLRFLFHRRLTNIIFGLLVVGGSVAAFVAPPFTGLDTLPALGVVVLSLGMLLEDAAIVLVGIVIALIGVVLEVILGAAAINGISSLL